MQTMTFLAFVLMGLQATGLGAATPAGKARCPDLPDPVPQGLATSDWMSIRAAYETARHAVYPQSNGVLSVQNPGQAWRTSFDGRGFSVTPDVGGWTWGLELQRYGFAGAERAVAGAANSVSHGQGRVTYDWAGGLSEWFVNDRRGLEQGWTVTERPDRSFDAGPAEALLTFTLTVRGGLIPEVAAGGGSVSFVNAAGAATLNFGGLKAWDADGKTLPARFQAVRGQTALRVVVDERGARYPITVDPIAQQAYLKASNTGGAYFGTSVAISGDTVVVGAAGEAYVFVRSGVFWSQQAYLKGSNTEAGDGFGYAVAISGDTVVVGAYGESSNATGVNGNQADNSVRDSGAAYVFVRNGGVWSQQAYLKASNTGTNDQFGFTVAISGDTVVVGAFEEDSGATGVNGDQGDVLARSRSGAAYVFVRSGGAWSQQAYLKASNTGYLDHFGSSVAISGDTVVIGAEMEDSNASGVNGDQADNSSNESGAAYVFVRNAGVWSQQAYLKASNTETNDRFGYSVAISGDTVVVGARFESSNATGVNGSQADNSASRSGAAYVFVRSGGVWSQQAYLKASNTETNDDFGYSVAVSGDTVVIGAPAEGSSATGVNGNQSDNAAAGSGAAYVFVRSGGVWSQPAYLKASNTESRDYFGISVAVSGDTVVVGAQGEDSNATGINGNQANNSASSSGAAYVFADFIPAPEILVQQPAGTDLVDGTASINFGSQNVSTISLAKTFTITNGGTASLTGLAITKDGTNASDFTVGSLGTATLTPGGSTTFTATFAPGSTGVLSAMIHITSNDSDEGSFDIVLTGTGVNSQPVLSLSGFPVTLGEGQTATKTGTVSDANSNDIVTVTASVGTLTHNAGAGTWSWSFTPGNGPAQSQTVTISASDGVNVPRTRTFSLTVTNIAPTLELGANTNLPPGVGMLSRAIVFSDPATGETYAGTVDYGAGAGPQPLAVSSMDKTLTLAHAYAESGTFTVSVLLNDGDGGSALDSFTVTVSPLPGIIVQPASVTNECGTPGSLQVVAAGVGPLHYQWYFSLTNSPVTNAILNATNDTLALAASGNTAGAYFVVVSNMNGSIASLAAEMTVRDTTPPAITCPSNQLVTTTNPAGDTVTFAVAAADSCSALSGVNCNPPSGSIFPPGTTTVGCTAADVHGNSNLCSFMVTVNRAPLATTDGGSTGKDVPLSLALTGLVSNDSDPDNDPLTVLSVSPNSSDGGTVTLAATHVTYAPPAGFTGVDRFSYTIGDGRGGVTSADVEVFVASGPLPSFNHVLLQSVPGGYRVRFAGIPGHSYRLQRSQDLLSWSALSMVTLPAHGIMEHVDPTTLPSSFYRVVSP